jgi:hypothetical protein
VLSGSLLATDRTLGSRGPDLRWSRLQEGLDRRSVSGFCSGWVGYWGTGSHHQMDPPFWDISLVCRYRFHHSRRPFCVLCCTYCRSSLVDLPPVRVWFALVSTSLDKRYQRQHRTDVELRIRVQQLPNACSQCYKYPLLVSDLHFLVWCDPYLHLCEGDIILLLCRLTHPA